MFFGAAIHNFGVRELLDAFVDLAPPPQPRPTDVREVAPDEAPFTGFVFKIQANMDPAHRDRIAFVRVCSGAYEPGMQAYHTRLGREVRVGDAITFMAADRQHVEEAYAGDIIGLHNHGTIKIGDTFTQGERLVFTGIPSFAPELFRRAVLRDPLKLKALQKGLAQLCEEGATQLFKPLLGNELGLRSRRSVAVRGGVVSPPATSTASTACSRASTSWRPDGCAAPTLPISTSSRGSSRGTSHAIIRARSSISRRLT